MPYKIEIVQRDITATDTDAIVNAANNHFWMGSGVAGAIKRVGGESIEKEAIAKGPKIPGEVIHTSAGKLKCKIVIHAAVMGQDLRTTDKLIRQSTIASLGLADKLKMTSIALPAFGTGVGGFPMTACANIMVTAALGYAPMAKHLTRVQFCMFDSLGVKTFTDALAKKR
jgi:O-acetyl-ADP-ribose deacetylase (regulator of RNase III)